MVQNMADQAGQAAEAARKLLSDQAAHLEMVSQLGAGIAVGLGLASTIVQIVHDLVRDAIGDIVGKIASAAIQVGCTVGLALPKVILDIVTLVGKWVTRLTNKIKQVVNSIDALRALFAKIEPLLAKLRAIFDKIGNTQRTIDDWATKTGQNIGHTIRDSDVPTVNEIRPWLRKINPNYDPWDANSPYSINCGECTANVHDTMNGKPVAEAGPNTLSTPEMEARTGARQVPTTPEAIEDALRQAGPGSHAVIGIDRGNDPGHWFNAYFDGKKVHYVDGQTGEISGWPPNLGNVTNWDASIFPRKGKQ